MSSLDLFGNPQTPHDLPPDQRGEEVYTLSLESTGEEIVDAQPVRHFYGITALAAGAVLLLAGQAYNLQVLGANTNRALAEGNSVRLITIPADRGLVVDFNGATLAQNTRKLALAINPQTLPVVASKRQDVYTLLKTKAGLSDDDISYIEKHRDTTPEPFAIKTNLTQEESLLYRDYFAATPGVILQEIPTRSYTDSPSLGQLLGYVGRPDSSDTVTRVGRTGLEQQYNPQLTGTPGVQHAEVNAQGEIVRLVPDPANSDPKPGSTLKLSLDENYQKIVADALTHELARRKAKLGDLPKLGASAVILDVQTGAVKAMVSLPDYPSSTFAQGVSATDYQALLDNPGNPLLNRAIQGVYPPGSTLKPLVASGGLQAGVITANTTMVTPDAIVIGNQRFPDWKMHGLTNTRKAIAESNDIFFYAVGGGWAEKGFTGLGIDRLNQYLADFGIGKKTGVDLPGENAGLLPDNSWKQAQFKERWFIGDTYHSSIGQGYLLTTPLQMADATAAIANGGTLYAPQLGWSTIDTTTNTETLLSHSSSPLGIDATNLQVVREGMRQTVESGSARPLNTLTVTSAGKTGTAQFGNQGLTHAWYTGFAPYDHPTIAFAIMIEGGGESFYSSVPVAEEILRGIFNDPLKPGQNLTSATEVPADYTGEH